MSRNWLVLMPLLAGGCRGDAAKSPPAAAQPGATTSAPLTPFEQENGIGPIKADVELGPLDESMAKAGKAVFELKCAACHKMSEKYVGPALGEVTTRRTGAYVMNMMLNPQEMVDRHPVAKQLLAEHLTFMPNQGLTQPEARQVLEYLRTKAHHAEEKGERHGDSDDKQSHPEQ